MDNTNIKETLETKLKEYIAQKEQMLDELPDPRLLPFDEEFIGIADINRKIFECTSLLEISAILPYLEDKGVRTSNPFNDTLDRKSVV